MNYSKIANEPSLKVRINEKGEEIEVISWDEMRRRYNSDNRQLFLQSFIILEMNVVDNTNIEDYISWAEFLMREDGMRVGLTSIKINCSDSSLLINFKHHKDHTSYTIIYHIDEKEYYLKLTLRIGDEFDDALLPWDICHISFPLYWSRMRTCNFDESIPPLFCDIAPKFFNRRIISSSEISHITESYIPGDFSIIIIPGGSNADVRLILEEGQTIQRYFNLEKIYTTPQSRGTYIKISRSGKVMSISDEIANDFDGNCDTLPVNNRGVIYWYDLLEACKDSRDIMESTLKQFGVDTLDECYDYLDNL